MLRSLIRLSDRQAFPSFRRLCTRKGEGSDSSEVSEKQEHVSSFNREDFLPKERPWELPKPASEILKPLPERWQKHVCYEPKINDDLSKVPDVTPYMQLRYRHPQFFVHQRQDGGTVFDSFKDELDMLKKSGKSILDAMNTDEDFPGQYDVIIIGGGIVGSSIAYHLREKFRELIAVLVIEKDNTYTHAASTTALTGFSQQFYLPENLQMAHYGADFARLSKVHLSMLENEPPDLHFTPTGYLYMAESVEQADTLLGNQERHTDYGSYVDVLNPYQLESRFPWLNAENVLVATHGVQDEGFVDQWAYLVAVRGKAEFLGARFIQAEFIDFQMTTEVPSMNCPDDARDCRERATHVIVRLPDGRERQIRCCVIIIAAGHESGNITKKLGIGTPTSKGMRVVPLPVEKRKRYYFVFNCPEGPGLDFPFLIDSSGVWCRREGLGGNFVCGKHMTRDEEPEPTNLDVDYGFFEHVIWPVLAKRVKAFERLKIVSAWAAYEDYNYFDQNPVIGKHHYFYNVMWATGFSGTALQMAPAVGRGITELIDTASYYYKTIDLGRFGWSRIFNGTPLREKLIVPPDMTPRIASSSNKYITD